MKGKAPSQLQECVSVVSSLEQENTSERSRRKTHDSEPVCVRLEAGNLALKGILCPEFEVR